ncbi:pentatricopeptide repeat-containing protein At2g35130 isoform X1 [Malus domestica]|uniref:pentatricopeptide repeat-containing protein At2g35130 isoform X1 n=1 Tax=Malus domestica TaxID=3750 RepID=UPI0010AA274B|nr:pentatricopeptide repeat-containing protein At2g35130 isoform X1 [Malus domestica]
MHLVGKDFVTKRKKFLSKRKKQGTSQMCTRIMPLWKLTAVYTPTSTRCCSLQSCRVSLGSCRNFLPHAAHGCEPDRASYYIMVDAYGSVGLHEDAQATFEEMKRLGITPTEKSHMLLLSAYSKAGNVAKCEDIVNQIQVSGLELDTFVINSILNLYGRLGQLEKMEEVMTAMEKGPSAADIST